MKKGPPKWEPTAEAFEAYLTKDLEHAKKNVSFAMQSGGSSHDTLHTRATAHEAMQTVLANRPTITRDPRRFSSTPRARKVST